MFHIISLISIIIMLMIVLVCLIQGRKAGFRLLIKHLNVLELLVFGITMLSVLSLTISGFSASLILKNPMENYLLMCHIIFGIIFITGLTVLSFLWAEACRFDVNSQTGWCSSKSDEKNYPNEIFSTWRKIFFWCFLISGLIATLAILLSMVPIFGTEGLKILYEVHRWFALCSVLTIIGFILHK